MGEDNNKIPTVKDTRYSMGNDNRVPTQADPNYTSGSSNRVPTWADPNYANSGSNRVPTEADTNYFSSANGRTPTEADANYAGAGNGRIPTQKDNLVGGSAPDNYSVEGRELTDLERVIFSVDASAFSSIEDFKSAAEKISKLVSYSGAEYTVTKTLSKSGGEAIILLCKDSVGKDVVAKVYFSKIDKNRHAIESKSRVWEYMKTEAGKRYTLAVFDFGTVEMNGSRYYFEMMPYCDSTDLSDDGPIPFEKLVAITKQINEALHSIHNAGIFHRDIKPENLYEFNGIYKIGDFGIARNRIDGDWLRTRPIGTLGYFAPETFRGIFGVQTDYYALGITIASLYEGHYIYDSYKDDEDDFYIGLAQTNEKIPFIRTDEYRGKIENLVHGLCKVNVKKRFGYEEVKKWLDNHDYVGEQDAEWSHPFKILKESCEDEEQLFLAISKDEEYWREGEDLLYRNIVKDFFAPIDTGLARKADIVNEKYRASNPDKGLSVFLKELYAPGPIVWKGRTFNSLAELGNKMLSGGEAVINEELLKNNCISHWLSNTEGIAFNADNVALVDEIESLSQTQPKTACYWFGNSFAEEKKLTICNTEVSDMDGLVSALFASPSAFYQTDGYDKLMDRSVGADLYGFLYSFGYKAMIDSEWERLSSYNTFNKLAYLLMVLESIAAKEGVDTGIIADFFVKYGPIGPAVYTKGLVKSGIYEGLDADGKKLLEEIKNYPDSRSHSVNELYRGYHRLVEMMETFRLQLIDNPYCILTGVYYDKGIIAKNLIGCFAFNIFGIKAPLGFCSLLEHPASGGER